MSSKAAPGKLACVTGASGYIASSWIVKLLLDRGYTVRATVRNTAVHGCDCVFHTASPIYHNVNDPQAELLDPALKGTLNVLGSCKKASIKRVVITSSIAAVAYNGKPRTPDVVVDETWFSLPEVAEKEKVVHIYCASITLMELPRDGFSEYLKHITY
ncbi:hypothetical protein GUJ93_ZPchr0001g29261 [Zizania palustris]|uniref:3-beta hydroxysteroid dehydrogenase/isomerase domain-containing protein n=1 Tax=Zizania palustris TaxID=103762 RepID=A0A8J5UZM1_ZIZPA|nr:hypothetical protein GUJ93_ZPchr0001g29261 [Zizania palustris]